MKRSRPYRTPFPVPIAALLPLLGALLGCGDSSTLGKDLQITNVQDSFQFQVTDTKKYSKTFEFAWANSKASATVDQSCSISEGSATLSIHDDAGTTVYARSLKDNGSYPTTAGTAGTWKIILNLSKVSGTLNFRVQAGP